MNHPLVSFCQLCYNQEDYIGPSLQAVLAQTYSPLEIIISDDASSDDSWKIIESVVANYKGPHKIILNKSKNNLGILGNLNKAYSLASGELLIKGDGDDISFPNRVERTVQEWLKYDRKPMLISSSYEEIDLNGASIGELLVPIDGWDSRDPESIFDGVPFFHPGPTSARSRKLFDIFGANIHVGSESATYVGRALMLGGLVGIREKLVKYRVGSGFTTDHSKYRVNMGRSINLGLEARYQLLEDLEKIKEQISIESYEKFKGIFEQSAERHKASVQLWTGQTLRERFTAYRKMYSSRESLKTRGIKIVLLLPHRMSTLVFKLLLWAKK